MDSRIELLLKIASAEVGYLEKASNRNLDSKTGNAGSNNYTKYARDLDNIPGFYNGPKNGYAWCDVFVDWCFVQAFGVDEAKKIYKLPTCNKVFPRDIKKERPCLNSHLDLCYAVCAVGQPTYMQGRQKHGNTLKI